MVLRFPRGVGPGRKDRREELTPIPTDQYPRSLYTSLKGQRGDPKLIDRRPYFISSSLLDESLLVKSLFVKCF